MPVRAYNWDFFLSHAGADAETAEQLFALLKPHARVFLDTQCLVPGDDWDTQLAAAIDSTLIVVVMVSARSEQAYYEGEEIATAIQLTRQSEGQRRVVPIYLDDQCTAPFGLRRKHSLYLTKAGSLEVVADSLLVVFQKTQSGEIKLVEKQAAALNEITAGKGKDRLAGLREITAVYRPIQIALLAMIGVTLGLMIFALLSPLVAADRGLVLSVLASTIVLMLIALVFVFIKSMDVARDIARSAFQRT